MVEFVGVMFVRTSLFRGISAVGDSLVWGENCVFFNFYNLLPVNL